MLNAFPYSLSQPIKYGVSGTRIFLLEFCTLSLFEHFFIAQCAKFDEKHLSKPARIIETLLGNAILSFPSKKNPGDRSRFRGIGISDTEEHSSLQVNYAWIAMAVSDTLTPRCRVYARATQWGHRCADWRGDRTLRALRRKYMILPVA